MADSKQFQEALKRGSAHAWSGRWTEAVAEYRLALQLSPEDASARTYLAMALYRSGQLREAMELYEALWKAQPSSLTMLQRMAELQDALGERESAAVSFRLLAEVHTRKRSPKEALKAWRKVVDLKPDTPLFWGFLMDLAVQVGEVAELMPRYLEFARELALAGRFDEALRAAEKAQTLDPDNPLVLPLAASLRRGLEYSWRAASLGEVPTREDLLRLIPRLEAVAEEAPLPVEELPLPIEEAPLPVEELPLPVEETSLPAEEAPLPIGEALLPAEGFSVSMEAGQAEEAVHQAWPEVEEIEAEGPRSGTAEEEEGPEALEPVMAGVEADSIAAPEPEFPEALAATSGEGQSDEVAELPPGEPSAVEAEPPALEAESPEASEGLAEEVTEPEAAEAVEPEPVESMEPEAPEAVEGEAPEAVEPRSEEDEEAAEPETPETPDWEVEEAAEPPATEAPEAEIEEPLEQEVAAAEVAAPAESEAEEAPEPVKEAAEAEEPAAPEPPEPEQPGAEQPEPALEPVEEASLPLTWEDLVTQAQEARNSGRLEEAVGLFQESLAAGAAIAEQVTELAEVYLQLGQTEQATAAFQQALGLVPSLPRALLGMARLHFAEGQLDDSEAKVRAAFEETADLEGEVGSPAVGLLLDILEEKAARGESAGAAESLAWLRARLGAAHLLPPLADRLAAAPVELLGRCVGEHLEEVAELPAEVRQEAVLALRWAEEQLMRGHPRSAADRVSSLVEAHPDFLPAQSLLGRVLVAQGRREEARERADRLLELYDLRGAPEQALEVLWWTVAQGVAEGGGRDRLVELLRSRGREEEAGLVELGWRDPSLYSTAAPTGASASLWGVAETEAGAGEESTDSAVAATGSTEETPAAGESAEWTLVAAEPAGVDPQAMQLREEAPTAMEPSEQESWRAWPSSEPTAADLEWAAAPEAREEAAAPEARPADETIEIAPPEDWREPPSASEETRGRLPSVVVSEEEPSGEAASYTETASFETLLRAAEADFASGDRQRAVELVRTALEEGAPADEYARAALLRVLQVLGEGERGQELAECLRGLGLPEDLAG